jgi:uncharacterized membrane protein
MFAIAGRSLFWALCLLVTTISLSILAILGLPGFEGVSHQLVHNATPLLVHVVSAATALLVMPFQFTTRLRLRRPGLHRWTGRIYAVAVLLGGLSGIKLALGGIHGPVMQSGFATLGALWIATTFVAIMAARRRDLAAHRRWIVYSAALTFAAVTLRLQIPTLDALGYDYDVFYPVVAWTSWLPNLLAVWLWRQGRALRPAPAPG